MLSDAYANAIAEVCKLIRLMVEDQPPELRREAWARWFEFFRPFWRLVGLDVPKEVPK